VLGCQLILAVRGIQNIHDRTVAAQGSIVQHKPGVGLGRVLGTKVRVYCKVVRTA
jgi:hypothetical protein